MLGGIDEEDGKKGVWINEDSSCRRRLGSQQET